MLLDRFIYEHRIAYFSMEIALRNEIPTYAGGLGVLAGDTMRSATDLEFPMVAVSLLSRTGYFRQELTPGGVQIEHPSPWSPAQWATALGAKVAVEIEGRPVWISAWLYILKGHLGGEQPVVLLDTDLDENQADDRRITDRLYGGDEANRLRQEIVLGVGGVRMLQALGFRIEEYHMNEGHSALLAVELLRQNARPGASVRAGESRYDILQVRKICNFTTHTPVEAGHDKFAWSLVTRLLGEFIELDQFKKLGGEGQLNLTRLALNLSNFVNGVAKKHAEISNRLYQGYRVHAVTNGVHPYTWTHDSFARIYDRHLPGWCHEPELLVRADCCIDDAEIGTAHGEAKKALIEAVRSVTQVKFDPEAPLIGFARRMTAYKRPYLLFSDLERLRAIARTHPFQIVIAGKAHPRDTGGKELIEKMHQYIRELDGEIKMAYLPDYDMATALSMVSGADVWLNTPLRPLEASGTSGMKAAFNGVPSLSVMDGWWIEGCIEGVTGWAIGDVEESGNGRDADALYHKLGEVVLPLYYEDRKGWMQVMKGAISKNASFFNSHRMMRRYVSEAYLR